MRMKAYVCVKSTSANIFGVVCRVALLQLYIHSDLFPLVNKIGIGLPEEKKEKVEASFEERPMHTLLDHYVYRVRVPSPLASKTSNKSLMDGIFFFLGLATLEAAGALGSSAPAFFLKSRTYLSSKQKRRGEEKENKSGMRGKTEFQEKRDKREDKIWEGNKPSLQQIKERPYTKFKELELGFLSFFFFSIVFLPPYRHTHTHALPI